MVLAVEDLQLVAGAAGEPEDADPRFAAVPRHG
jgi:hypothetical protein